MSDAKLISLECHSTEVGDLVVGSKGAGIGFVPKRVYYLYDIPAASERGGHAHKELQQVIVALAGAFDVVLDDGRSQSMVTLNQPTKGLSLPPGLWRELRGFSGGAICLVLASNTYDENDYVRVYEEFKSWKNHSR
ncbi:FdtA/QdtA family cupin domain-containing protein [Flavobacteriales bacterium]|nr:FdtA/QdtA family cupin domain-containing protein [Flavobacteriales bacterium]